MPHHRSYESQITLISSNLPVQRLTRAHWQANTLGWLHFNKVRIKDRDQHKVAFKTKYGLYEPMVMYFGLCNSPATFQNMMNHIFQPLKDKWAKRGVKIIVYMDDILIATSTSLQDHRDAPHMTFLTSYRNTTCSLRKRSATGRLTASIIWG